MIISTECNSPSKDDKITFSRTILLMFEFYFFLSATVLLWTLFFCSLVMNNRTSVSAIFLYVVSPKYELGEMLPEVIQGMLYV